MSRDAVPPLLTSDEPPPVAIVNPEGRGRIVLVCDHASNRMPKGLGDLGVPAGALERHVAWDIGAREVALRLSDTLDAPLVLSGYSRLVVDCNRSDRAADLFVTLSEDVEVPGNRDLTEQDRAARMEGLFWPYQDAIHRTLAVRLGRRPVPVLVSIHSFTPVYNGDSRPWDVSIMYRHDSRLARLLIDRLASEPGLTVGDNVPYQVVLDEDYTLPVHAESRGVPYVLIEVRQDLIDSATGVEEWAGRLGSVLSEVVEHPSLATFSQPALDVHEPRYLREGLTSEGE